MSFADANAQYETWLAKKLTIIPDDLALKHRKMAESAFPFLRATFFRWAQLWISQCPGLHAAPKVLAVGDLHVENFGTWRDIEGRLVWGVNDFDEACPMPYTIDLVRLAASAILATAEQKLDLHPDHACDAILTGYRSQLECGGEPFVLSEHHQWLRKLATSASRDPKEFWRKMTTLPDAPENLRAAGAVAGQFLPEQNLQVQWKGRRAGLGSLGRVRVVALANWRGGWVAREAKALAPSAFLWASGSNEQSVIHYDEILRTAVRCPDPFVHASGSWIVRRLAPDCSRVELTDLAQEHDSCRLLENMGRETANVHLASGPAIAAVRDHLNSLKPGWLQEAATKMKDLTVQDFREWQRVKA